MVEKLKQLLAELETQRGKVSLLALFKMDEVVDKYTILLGASWVTDTNDKEIFGVLRSYIVEHFTTEERATIAKIGVYNNSSHLIQELLKYKSGTDISDKTQVNGNIIHEGMIIKSEEN